MAGRVPLSAAALIIPDLLSVTMTDISDFSLCMRISVDIHLPATSFPKHYLTLYHSFDPDTNHHVPSIPNRATLTLPFLPFLVLPQQTLTDLTIPWRKLAQALVFEYRHAAWGLDLAVPR